MRLRTFLVKRGIHTAITLIIVLVLLFVTLSGAEPRNTAVA